MNRNLCDGYLYCLFCPQWTELKEEQYKLGKTINLQQRLNTYRTSNYESKFILTLPNCPLFETEFCKKTNFPSNSLDVIGLREQALFIKLEPYRMKKTELFKCSFQKVKEGFEFIEKMSKDEIVQYLNKKGGDLKTHAKVIDYDDLEAENKTLIIENHKLRKEILQLKNCFSKNGLGIKIEEAIKGYKNVLFKKLEDILLEKKIKNETMIEIKDFLLNGPRPKKNIKEEQKEESKPKEPLKKEKNKKKDDPSLLKKKFDYSFILYNPNASMPTSNVLTRLISPAFEKEKTDIVKVNYDIDAIGNGERLLWIQISKCLQPEEKIKEIKTKMTSILRREGIKSKINKE